MRFDERYELVDLEEDENVKIYVAREISTGRTVDVFLFGEEQARAHAELIEQLRAADRRQFPELIEVGSHHGNPYVVTTPLGTFSELKIRASHLVTAQAPSAHKADGFSKVGIWHVPKILTASPHPSDKSLPQAPPQPTPAPPQIAQLFQTPAAPIGESAVTDRRVPSQPPTAPSAQPASGEFTRLFQAPAAPIGESSSTVPRAPEQAAATPSSAQPAPGEFTRLFQASAAPIGESSSTVPRTPEQAAATPPSAQPAPGEFTRFFQAPAAPIGESNSTVPLAQEQAAATPPSAQPAPGEFTRFFQAAQAPSSEPMSLPEEPETEGQFTRIFGSASGPETPPQSVASSFDSTPSPETPVQPPPSYGPSSDFTRIFGSASGESPAPPPGMPVSTAVPTPQAGGAPGEYTRMFGAQPFPPAPSADQEPEPATPAVPESSVTANKHSWLPLVLIGIILLLLTVIAILRVGLRT